MKVLAVGILALGMLLMLSACSAMASAPTNRIPMLASVYWQDQWTAMGGRFDANGMTAAHKTIPLGTRLTVHYGRRSVVLLVNDRGPYFGRRELDLSKGAAKALRFPGLGRVKVESWPPLPKSDPRKD